ncbi:uncharacterized protein STEHIDRAFT_64864 [Stereum hirsutum FP-91666 SS1]|uniref:uncharacterized protein n=1 Tax=Stereum hirsutum (strain FP-91666) TaxID=721885 RepID=UPI00044494A0|nr:uncharacterized protein STEHIDRAFT_64864 [Stereum hirsutum FP-91666 SS1]EIM82375.1 hypothetical protein STEHIDRAFT_64864 [Stereum hirsutum FP-91666 SS1]
MTYLGTSDGGHGNIFMRENNSMFTAAHVLFDENLFPRCSESNRHKSNRLPHWKDPQPTIPPDDDGDVPPHQHYPPERRPDPEQDVAPPAVPQRDPSPPPQPRNEPPAPLQEPRRSGRERRAPTRLTGGKGPLPTEQQIEPPTKGAQRRAQGPQPGRSSAGQESNDQNQVPGPSSEPNTSGHGEPSVAPGDEAGILARLCREGGAELIHFLMAKAVPLEGEFRPAENVREWTYKDIARLPKAERDE